MTDLYLAAAAQLALAASALLAGRGVARRGSLWVSGAAVLAACLAIGAYLQWGRATGAWTHLFPVSSAIVYANPSPVLASFLAGVISGLSRVPRWRRVPLVAVVVATGGYETSTLFNPAPPPVRAVFNDGVALQTHTASCSPAAAATLLRAAGVPGAEDATEASLVGPCLTDARGTPLLGLYRGLKLATAQTPYEPTFHNLTPAELRHRPELLPAIINVKLTAEVDFREPRYRARWGWLLNVTHSVVVFRFYDDGQLEVGDPSIGRELWSMQALTDLWAGEVLTLEKQPHPLSARPAPTRRPTPGTAPPSGPAAAAGR